MNELTIFNNPEFGEVRTIIIDGEPWFVGNDVATALGYTNARKALADHVDNEDKQLLQKGENTAIDVPNRGLTVINMSGVYSLILSSKLPNAKKFKRWITTEVLPAIQKTGGYQSKPLSAAEMFQLQAQINVEQERRLSAIEANQKKVIEACSVPAMERDQWQEGMKKYLSELCESAGLSYPVMYGDLYGALERKMGCNLETRQKNLRRRMKAAGATYKEQQAASKLAVIAKDKALASAFEGIVQRYAADLAARRWERWN